jgi:regulatory protein
MAPTPATRSSAVPERPLPAGPITRLEPDPRHAGSVRLYIERVLYCTVPQEAVVAERLRAGQVLDPGLHERLGVAAEADAAHRVVIRALERSAAARRDLERRLVRRGHAREAVSAALDRAECAGLLDDAAFAQHYVRTRAPRGRGPVRLIRDLLAKGVAREVAERAVAEQWPAGADHDEVAALAARRAGQLGELPRPVLRRRLLAFLARRGYGGHDAVRAVSEVLRSREGSAA